MLKTITAIAEKFKKEKEQKMLEKIIDALLKAQKDGVRGTLKTEDANLLVNEILILRETNKILASENNALTEGYNSKCDEITELIDERCRILDRLKFALDGAEMYAKHAEDAKRKIRLNNRSDIMKVYGYRES